MAVRSFWNQICQFGCSCPSCSSHSPIHQRGKAAYQTVRSRPFNSSTLLYTVLFGYATALDGSRRFRRKEQWEEAIAETKNEIEKLEAVMVQRTKKIIRTRLGEDGPVLEKSVSGRWQTDVSIDPETAREEASAASQYREDATGDRLARFMEYPVGHYTYPSAPLIPTLDSPRSHSLPPQSLWSHKHVRMMGDAAWTKKKTYGVEICMARLVLELCIASGLSGLSADELEDLPMSVRPYAALSKTEAQSLAQQFELELLSLHSTKSESNHVPVRRDFSVPIPQYRDEYSKGTADFSTRIAQVCDKKTVLGSTSIADICGHIMNCYGKPDIQMVNNLLVAFTRCRRPDLLKPTISLVYDAHFRPNEITCASILRHYRQQKDEKRFMEYVSMMRGEKSALMLANPQPKTFHHPERSRGRCIPAANKIYQAVTPSSLTYLEMIMGLVQFVGLEKTLAYCTNLAAYGWGFDYACIYMLLFRSAVESVTSTCLDLWKQAERLSLDGHRLPRRLYALMIAIHKLENNNDQSWLLFEDCVRKNPQKKHHILEMVEERMKLIKQTRIAEKNVQERTFDRLEEEFKNGAKWANNAVLPVPAQAAAAAAG